MANRLCKCGHDRQKHKNIFLKAIECTPGRCGNPYSMIRFHHCRDEKMLKGYGACFSAGCNCKSMKPESNIGRQTRLQNKS